MLASELFIKYLFSALAAQTTIQGFKRSTSSVNSSYDYVIVGGGTSGLVVASRLTENAQIRVLVLESGGAGSQYTDIPHLANEFDGRFASITKVYDSVQSRACGDRPCQLYVGRGLGGGSVRNGMVFSRGSKLDYDEWATSGATGWSYKEVLLYFKKLESAEARLGSDQYRGRTGPLRVTENSGQNYAVSRFAQRFLSAASSLGLPVGGDFNGARQNIFTYTQATVRNGHRQSSDNAYVRPFESRKKNLDILAFAFVTRILFKGKQAVGVEYSRFNRTFQVFATREVILSAGALSSPKILMLSGVGPKEQLKQFNIPIVTDLSGVGHDLRDHSESLMIYDISLEPSESNKITPSEQNYCRWKVDGSGVFGSAAYFGVGSIATNYSTAADDPRARLDMYLTFNTSPRAPYQVNVLCWNLKIKSSGALRLKSSNPFDDPLLDLNSNANDEDRHNLFQCLTLARKMMKTKPFVDIRAKIVGPKLSNCPNAVLESDEYITCRSGQISPGDHISSTCKMGAASDPLAVVDPELRVLGGIQNLRIADNSIMPTLVRGNTQAVAYMIGEKASDMIMRDFLPSQS